MEREKVFVEMITKNNHRTTHDFLSENNKGKGFVKPIPFDYFFPQEHQRFIRNFVIELLIKAEKDFHSRSYRRICSRKRKYDNRKSAKRAISSMIRKGKGKKIAMRAYNCHICKHFHTTSKNDILKKQYHITEKACILEVHPDNIAILIDTITGATTQIHYEYREEKIIKIRMQFEENGPLFNMENNTYNKEHSNVLESKALHNHTVNKNTAKTFINSAHLTIPNNNYLNIHNFIYWLEKISTSDIFYGAIKDENNENGVIIITMRNNKIVPYIAKLYKYKDTYKLWMSQAEYSKNNHGNFIFKEENNVYTMTSQLFTRKSNTLELEKTYNNM